MKHRTITLVIILLVFTSVTLATPTESTEYHDSEFLDEIGAYTTGAWNCVAPTLEPIAGILHTTAANNPICFDNDHETRSTLPNLPSQPDQGILLDRQTMAFQPQAVSDAELWYSSTPMIHQQPYDYPQSIQVPFDDTNLQGLTTGAIQPFESRSVGLPDMPMQTWLDNTYVPGHGLPPSWPELPQHPQYQELPVVPPPMHAVPTQFLNHTPISQTVQQQSMPHITAGHLQFGDCPFPHTNYTFEDLQHHPTNNAQQDFRRYSYPHHHQPLPRQPEIQTPPPTRNLRRPHYCSVPSCPYATKGFGRRDHLTRHMRCKHGADSILQNSDTSSSIGGATSG